MFKRRRFPEASSRRPRCFIYNFPNQGDNDLMLYQSLLSSLYLDLTLFTVWTRHPLLPFTSWNNTIQISNLILIFNRILVLNLIVFSKADKAPEVILSRNVIVNFNAIISTNVLGIFVKNKNKKRLNQIMTG